MLNYESRYLIRKIMDELVFELKSKEAVAHRNEYLLVLHPVAN